MSRVLIFVIILLSGISEINAQNEERLCLIRDQGDVDRFESWISLVHGQKVNMRLLSTASYNVPVIVHVVHDGEQTGEGTNISLDQIYSQLEVLNNDFKRLNSDTINTPVEFLNVASDMDVSFNPAWIDPMGDSLPEPGVNRIDRNTMAFSPPPYHSDYFFSDIMPATIWDTDSYLNIWVGDLSNVLGVAQFPEGALPDLPSSQDPTTDGVVVRHSAFGTLGTAAAPFNLGRTTTHEIGHWLGLYHIWGLSGSNACNEDDYVTDTPNQDAPHTVCPSMQGGMLCSGVTREMWENYMEFTPDACMNLFTQGQVDRMTTVLENALRRAPLLSATSAGKLDQSITFNVLPDFTFGDPDFDPGAIASSGLEVVYESSDTDVVDVVGSQISIIGAGVANITARQSGDLFYNSAEDVLQQVIINAASQEIDFPELGEVFYTDSIVTLMGMATSGLVVTYESSDPSIADMEEDVMIIHGVGSIQITAFQDGDNNHLAADPVTITVDIQKGVQTITFDPLEQETYLNPPFVLNAVSTSGLEVEFESSDPSKVSILGDVATIHAAGVVTITATQPGDELFNMADPVGQPLVIDKADQQISITLANTMSFGDSTALIGDASSGLLVSYSVLPDGVLGIRNGFLHADKPGLSQLTAFQSGNSNYNAATDVMVEVLVEKAETIILIEGADKDYPDTLEVLPIQITSNAGLELEVTDNNGVIHWDGQDLNVLSPGQVLLEVTHPGNENYNPGLANASFCVLPVPEITLEIEGSDIILSSNYPASNTTWEKNGTFFSQDSLIVAEPEQEYRLNVDYDGCMAFVTITPEPLAIGEITNNEISLFPNPASTEITVRMRGQFSLEPTHVRITDLGGKVFMTKSMLKKESTLLVANLPSGIYLLVVQQGNSLHYFKFVKN